MRIILKLSKNQELVPFNYQGHLVYKLHEWIGKNNIHDDISLYSFSWLSKGQKKNNRLNFPTGSEWMISAYNSETIKSLIRGIQTNPMIAFGMGVQEIRIMETPQFKSKERFSVASPVMVRKREEDGMKYQYHNDKGVNELLTQTLQTKLKKAGLKYDAKVSFDETYHRPKIKMIRYKGIDIKGSICPIIIEGDQEAISFAWDVGIGHSTGIGFGALI